MNRNFDAEKAARIVRIDVIDYFISELEYFEPDLLSKGKLADLQKDLKNLRKEMDPKGANNAYTADQMKTLGRQVDMILTRALMVPVPAR